MGSQKDGDFFENVGLPRDDKLLVSTEHPLLKTHIRKPILVALEYDKCFAKTFDKDSDEFSKEFSKTGPC